MAVFGSQFSVIAGMTGIDQMPEIMSQLIVSDPGMGEDPDLIFFHHPAAETQFIIEDFLHGFEGRFVPAPIDFRFYRGRKEMLAQRILYFRAECRGIGETFRGTVRSHPAGDLISVEGCGRVGYGKVENG